VLDAGCGSGVYSQWLVEQGADVVGVDVSSEMLGEAGERVGDRVEFYRSDLETAFDFATDDEFDGAVSGSVFDHVEDWGIEVPHYPRPLSAVVNPLLEAGFRLEELVEPRPTERFREKEPEAYDRLQKRPYWLCVRATRS
jgi:SAM-dependent methyltransferase